MTAAHYSPSPSQIEAQSIAHVLEIIAEHMPLKAQRKARKALFAAARRAMPNAYDDPRVVSLNQARIVRNRPDIYEQQVAYQRHMSALAEAFSDAVDANEADAR